VKPYPEMSPIELVQACAGSRDSAAWVEFQRRFHPVIASGVLRTARRHSNPPSSLIDDLVQDTYVRLCEDDCRILRRFQPRHEESIFAFLKVVASNVVRDYYKSADAEKRGANKTDAITEIPLVDPKTEEGDGEAFLHRKIEFDRILDFLRQQLSGDDGERNLEIFLLRHCQGHTASEISGVKALGLSTEGVESVLLRLNNMIRSHIENTGLRSDLNTPGRQNRSRRLER